ncbi:hypothetical protein SRHO_G00046470 [Serrasalmus rhombeus]
MLWPVVQGCQRKHNSNWREFSTSPKIITGRYKWDTTSPIIWPYQNHSLAHFSHIQHYEGQRVSTWAFASGNI